MKKEVIWEIKVSVSEKTRLAPPSTRRSVQFVAMLYIHTLWLVIFVTFSRNVFSKAIRTVLLPRFRQSSGLLSRQ